MAIEELWKRASWALQIAQGLRAEGQPEAGRALPVKTLGNLERDRELHPPVLAALHRELARIDLAWRARGVGPDAPLALPGARRRRRHDAGGEGRGTLGLAELFDSTNKSGDAMDHYRTATRFLLELVRRRPSVSKNLMRLRPQR